MAIRSRSPLLVAAACVLLVATSPAAHAGGMSGVVSADEVSVGAGSAHTYVAFDDDRTPTAVGVRLDTTALDELPIGMLPTTQEYVLPLPEQAATTIFDHVTLDWNSHGHNPEHGFDIPHIDVHFYLIDPAAREAIHPLTPGYIEASTRLPDPRYLPDGYAAGDDPLLGTVPGMGLHWLDTGAHDHHFTETVLHGTWDGQVVFIEPMMTREWLTSKPDLHEDLPQPAAYQQSGAYPTTYSVTWDEAAQEYVIELGGLTPREPS